MLNAQKSYYSASHSISLAGSFTDINGNAKTSIALIITGTSGSGLSTNDVLNALNKLSIVGLTSASNYSTNWSPSGTIGAYYVLYDVGYRSGGFTESTTERIPQSTRYNSLCAVSINSGVPTFTITNSGSASITINEIDFGIACDLPYSTAVPFLIAGFNLGEITIAPNDSYSFTITNI